MPRTGRHLKLGARDAISRVLRLGSAKPTGYIGWIGYNNLGDEALYEAILGLMNPVEIREYSAVREVELARVGLSGPAHLQAVLLGGGTLIGPGFLRPVRLALGQGLPLYSFGTGVGSSGFGEEWLVDLAGWRDLLCRFRGVSVRGFRSQEKISRMGVSNVTIIGDPALALGPTELPGLRSRPTLVINLALSEGQKYGEGICTCYREIARIARDHVAKDGEVIPVALGNGDTEALRACLADAGLAYLPVRRPKSTKEFTELISGAHCLIGVRLHAAVLATVVGTMPVMIAYRDKCWDFTESMEVQNFTVDHEEGAGPHIRVAYERAMAEVSGRTALFERVKHWRRKQAEFAAEVVANAYPR